VMLCVAALASLLVFGGVAWGQAGSAVLFPADGSRVVGESCWLVVRSGAEPRASLDGRDLPVARAEAGVYHWRLEGLRAEGSRIAGDAAGREFTLTVYGGAPAPGLFHSQPPEACWECHGRGEDGCAECHRWTTSTKHTPVLAQGCARCHEPPRWEPREMAPVCGACHADHANGRHPRLRHPVSAARDPLRPGRRMDCASCHDPHAPRCLSCLGRQELREWCKVCHGSP